MKEIIQWYKESLVSRMQALNQAKSSLLKNQKEVIPSLRRLAHSLKGSGGTYGFSEISEAAGLLEEAEEKDIPILLEKLIESLQTIISSNQEEKTGILIIEDDRDFSRIMAVKLFNPLWEIYTADSVAAALEILLAKSIALIILDLILPDMDGRQFLVQLKERISTSGIPVIVMTAKSGNQTRTECLALGAEEFFEKPLDPEVIFSVVSSHLKKIGEISQQLHQDPLTGLLNRAAFCEAFDRNIALSIRQKQSLAFAILDFDRFKSVNDTYGHAMGDEVLRSSAELISQTLRKSDVVGRWGGEEFVILFPSTTKDGAREVLKKVLYRLREKKFKIADGNEFSVSFSAGVIQIDKMLQINDAVFMADHFLYQAKENGGNRVLMLGGSEWRAKKQVLFAEDDEAIAHVVKNELDKAEFQVLHYSDGTEAWKASSELRPALVILDVKMPGLDGFELLEKLRGVPYYHSIPIIMLTSVGNEKDIVHGLELGADDYILKPFSSAELLARIRRLLKRQERA